MSGHCVTEIATIIEEWPDATPIDLWELADAYRVLAEQLSELAESEALGNEV